MHIIKFDKIGHQTFEIPIQNLLNYHLVASLISWCQVAIKIMPHFVLCSLTASATEPDFKSKDWVFLNYTYKRFEGLTQRGTIPTYMKAGKAWHAALGENRRLRTQGQAAEPRCWWRLCQQPQYKFNPHHRLFRSAQSLQVLPRAPKIKQHYRITSVVYIVYTCCLLP